MDLHIYAEQTEKTLSRYKAASELYRPSNRRSYFLRLLRDVVAWPAQRIPTAGNLGLLAGIYVENTYYNFYCKI
jgi:hypothetical protein